MTIALQAPIVAPSRSIEPVLDGFVMDGASWELYELLLRDVGHQNVRVTYDRGRLLIMSPRPDHEIWKELIGLLVVLIAVELDIPIRSLGSTTWRRREMDRGLEADKCYYVQNERLIRGRMNIDLATDPPPDLAIEIEVTHAPIDRPSIYAALKVPEIWRFNGDRIVCGILQPDGTYLPAERSAAFPMLSVRDLEPFIAQTAERTDNEIVRSFQAWLRSELQKRQA